MPRPMLRPARQAVDPARRSSASRAPAALSPSMNASMFGMRSLSVPDPGRRDAHHPELDLEDVAGEPHAADRGAEQLALHRRASTRRCGRRRRAASARVTCAPKQPSRWWFLPWTSAATIPPSVTNCVPGVTGTNQPRGQEQPVDLVAATAPPRRAGRRSRVERQDAIGQHRRRDLAIAGARAATSRRTSGRARATAAGRR